MAEPAEFAPAELDRIEDALEFLEHDHAGEDTSYAVRQRLADYRRIAQLSRTALPMIDAPRSVLANVLAAARESCEVPTLAPSVAESPPPVREGFWSRVRRFAVLPGVALAGTAALVLVMVQQRDAPKLDSVAREPVADGAPAVAENRAEFARPEPTPAKQTAAPGPVGAPAAAAAPAAAPPTPIDAPAVGLLDKAEDARRSAEPSVDGNAERERAAEEKKPAEDEPRPAPGSGSAPAKDAELGMPRWDIIARGDRARHKGDCDAAASEYRLALEDPDPRVRARAHAGLGLCDAADGDASAAEAAYKAARELDPEIVAFIDDERPRGSGATSGVRAARAKKSKPKAASKAKADTYGDAN